MIYMLNGLLLRTLLTITLLVLTSITVFGGWVITEESIDSYGNKAIQTTFIQDNFIRHETVTSIAIIDLEKKLITIVFSQYKLYWSGTIQELKESSMEVYDRQMEQMLVGLPESARAEFDSIYSNLREQALDTNDLKPERNIKVIKTDVEEEIIGYKALKYNILIDSVLVESVWHTDEIKPYNDINIKNMIAFINQLNPGSSKGSISQTEEYLELLKSGILLKSVEQLPDGNSYELNVTNVRETDIVLDFFDPPVNYMKASFSDILNLMPKFNEETNSW